MIHHFSREIGLQQISISNELCTDDYSLDIYISKEEYLRPRENHYFFLVGGGRIYQLDMAGPLKLI